MQLPLAAVCRMWLGSTWAGLNVFICGFVRSFRDSLGTVRFTPAARAVSEWGLFISLWIATMLLTVLRIYKLAGESVNK